MFRSFKKLFNKEEGYILVTSFVVLLVIVILGVVYANLAITQARQAEQHNDRKQAYYYARSGSERAYLEIAEGLIENDVNEMEKKFFDFSWDMTGNLNKQSDINENEIINVNINLYDEDENEIDLNEVELNINDLEKIKVVSTGKVGDIKVNKRANYRLEYNDITDIPDNYSKQAENWVKPDSPNAQSLVIDRNEDSEYLPEGNPDEEAVFLTDPNNASLKFNNGTGEYTASIFYFQSKDKTKPLIIRSSLILHSNIVIINVPLDFGPNGELCIYSISEEDDVIIYFDKESEIESVNFEGFYTLKEEAAGNVCLPDEQEMLIPYNPKRNIDNWDQIWE
mgnify:CR=1 FL=1